MKDLGAAKRILGMEITSERDKGRLYMTQRTYIGKVLKNFYMQHSKKVTTPIAQHLNCLVRIHLNQIKKCNT